MSGVCDGIFRHLCAEICAGICAGIGVDFSTYSQYKPEVKTVNTDLISAIIGHDCTAHLCECGCCCGTTHDQDYATEREALLADSDRMETRDTTTGSIQTQQPSATQSPSITR